MTNDLLEQHQANVRIQKKGSIYETRFDWFIIGPFDNVNNTTVPNGHIIFLNRQIGTSLRKYTKPIRIDLKVLLFD